MFIGRSVGKPSAAQRGEAGDTENEKPERAGFGNRIRWLPALWLA